MRLLVDYQSTNKYFKSILNQYFTGLNLVLNIGVYEYISSLTDEAGARIVIHPQNVMPFPGFAGISVAPGQTSNIALKKVRTTLLFKTISEKSSKIETRFSHNYSLIAGNISFYLVIAYRPSLEL